jgi:hypothetical protein
MEEWVFSNSLVEAMMVNQVGDGLVGKRAPSSGPGLPIVKSLGLVPWEIEQELSPSSYPMLVPG